jgi:predicted metal-dependent HD superfamily phosphohydrolase
LQELEHAWEQVLQTFGVEHEQAQKTFLALVQVYASPSRVYHTLEHIRVVLQWIERLGSLSTDLPALQLAQKDDRGSWSHEPASRVAVVGEQPAWGQGAHAWYVQPHQGE